MTARRLSLLDTNFLHLESSHQAGVQRRRV